VREGIGVGDEETEAEAWEPDLVRLIDEHGWACMGVFDPDGDRMPFMYTVGLTKADRPELLLIGPLAAEPMQAILNDLGRQIFDQNARFTHGQVLTDVLEDYPLMIVDLPEQDAGWPLAAANTLYGEGDVAVQQVVWPDKGGLFPWQDGYAYPAEVQPILGPAPTE
jgi:Domain of unknown function (DUF4262)